jgi:hypothetical protein
MKTFVIDAEVPGQPNAANQAINELVPHYRSHKIIATVMTATTGPFIGTIELITPTEITIRWSEDDDDPTVISRCEIADFRSDFERIGRRLEMA